VALGLLCLLIVAMDPLPAQATAPRPADPPLTMEVAVAWEGHTRIPGWTEATITLRNEGADWSGTLAYHDDDQELTYHIAVVLPAHSHKQYRLPLFAKGSYRNALTLVSDAGVEAQRTSLEIENVNTNQRLCAVVGAPAARALESCDLKLWLEDAAALPETAMAWDTVDVVLLNGTPAAELTPLQQQALLAWVGAGGYLVAGGGGALPQVLESLPPKLQVATATDAQVLTLTFEGDDAGAVSAGEVAVTTLAPRGNAKPVQHATSGAITAVSQAVGTGHVDIVGWDLTLPASSVWLAARWANAPTPALHSPITNQTLSSGTPHIEQMGQVAFDKLPPLWRWLLLFPIYLILMGPGTLILVRRLRRPILAWILLPLWIVIALVVLALGLNGTFSRAFPLVHEIAVINVPGAGLPARVVQGTAVYAPRLRHLHWQLAGAPRPMKGHYMLESGWYTEGDPFPVDVHYHNEGDGDARVQISRPMGVITWGAEGLHESPPFQAHLHLEMGPGGTPVVAGSLWSEGPLRDVALVLGNGEYGLALTEVISAGARVAVSKSMTRTYRFYSNYRNLCTSWGSVGRAPMYPSMSSGKTQRTLTGCYITGHVEGVPFPAQDIGGTHIEESCIIYTVPCPERRGSGQVEIALESLRSKISNGWIDQTTGEVYVSSPNTTLVYHKPTYLSLTEINALEVSLQPAKGSGSSQLDLARLQIWEWNAERWESFPLIQSGTTVTLTQADALQFFDPQEGVRVRLYPSSTSGTVVDLRITLKGN
jgi:hypothetical protein